MTFQAVFDISLTRETLYTAVPPFELQVTSSDGLLEDAQNYSVIDNMERLFCDGLVLRARDQLYKRLIDEAEAKAVDQMRVLGAHLCSDLVHLRSHAGSGNSRQYQPVRS